MDVCRHNSTELEGLRHAWRRWEQQQLKQQQQVGYHLTQVQLEALAVLGPGSAAGIGPAGMPDGSEQRLAAACTAAGSGTAAAGGDIDMAEGSGRDGNEGDGQVAAGDESKDNSEDEDEEGWAVRYRPAGQALVPGLYPGPVGPGPAAAAAPAAVAEAAMEALDEGEEEDGYLVVPTTGAGQRGTGRPARCLRALLYVLALRCYC